MCTSQGQHRAGAEPWFCFTGFIKPHPPFDPPVPWNRLYDPLAMRDPVRIAAELERLTLHVRNQHRFKWTSPDAPPEVVRVLRAYYYASVSFVDHEIGRILDALERLGLRSNTLVVFTADHGEYLGDHWAYGKRGYHDSAARLPLILSWPDRLPGGTTRDDLAGLTDLAPTLLSAAHLVHPGHDLLSGARREALVGQYQHGARGLYLSMDADHKYVYSAAEDRESLLRVGSTPGECEDLVDDPALAPHRDRLRDALLDRFAHDGYTEPLADHGWRRFPPVPAEDLPGDRSPEGRGLQYARWKG